MSDNTAKPKAKKAAAGAPVVSTKPCKVKCTKNYGGMREGTVYTVSENTAEALIAKKVASKA